MIESKKLSTYKSGKYCLKLFMRDIVAQKTAAITS